MIVADLASTQHLVRTHRLKLRALMPTHSADRLYPSFGRERAELHRRIDAVLAQMLRDGTVERVYQRVLGISYTDLLPRE